MDFDISDMSDLSSVPSSPRSSPEPAKRYLTPSSQDSPDEVTRQDFCPPAKKRRRNPLPKERTTQYLSFAKSSAEQPDQVKLLVETLRHQKDIVVIAGAGISTSAGIPDFRSTDGLFKSLQQKHNLKASGKLLFDAAVYQDDALTAPFHELVRSLSIETAKTKPTRFHEMLARLGKESRLKRLYTQNIDGLETSMQPLETEIPLLSTKGRWPVTIQLHGSIQKMVCQKCRYLCDLDPSRFRGAEPPECDECSEKDEVRQTTGQRSHGIGRMRPRIVLYNEHNPDEEAITSVMNADARSRPRVLVVAGTSLKIPGVRRLVKTLCPVIRSRKDGVTMFINNEPPVGKEFENCFDLVVQGSTDQVADVVQLKHWEDERPYDMLPEPVFGPKPGIEVVIPTTPKKDTRVETGLATPSSSQDEMSCEPSVNGPPAGKIRNPASKGVSLKDVLKDKTGSKAAPKNSGPAKGGRRKPAATTGAAAKKPAAKAAATKKRGGKAAPAANASITSFSRVSKSGAVAPAAGKKGGKPMDPRSNNPIMFPNLAKNAGSYSPEKAAALEGMTPEVLSAPS